MDKTWVIKSLAHLNAILRPLLILERELWRSWVTFSLYTQWPSYLSSQSPGWPPIIPVYWHTSPCRVPPTLYYGWSARPIEYGRSDRMWFLRFIHKKALALVEAHCHVKPRLRISTEDSSVSHDKGLRPPANSHVKSHRDSRLSSPSQAFKWLLSKPRSWLQPQKRP